MRPWFDSWVRKIPWRRDKLPTPVFLGFPCGSAGKESTCNVGDLGWIPGLGRYPGKGNSYPLQCSGLESSMDCIVHGVTKSQTQLIDFHFHFQKGYIHFCVAYKLVNDQLNWKLWMYGNQSPNWSRLTYTNSLEESISVVFKKGETTYFNISMFWNSEQNSYQCCFRKTSLRITWPMGWMNQTECTSSAVSTDIRDNTGQQSISKCSKSRVVHWHAQTAF